MKRFISFTPFLLLLVGVSCQNTTQQPATERPGTKTVEAGAPDARPIKLPAGTAVVVRLEQALSTTRNKAGDTFAASLAEPVIVDGKVVLPKGARFTGHVTRAKPSGRLKGRGVLGITLDSFELNGQTYQIASSPDTRTTAAHTKRNIEIIGGGAGVGAVVGAIAGGKKGAAIGAGAGAAAGTATAAATGVKHVEVPAETIFRFTLKQPVTVMG